MGQKVHPFGIRLGYNKNWLSRWFSAKEYPAFVLEDSKIRKFVKNRNAEAGLAKIEIERAGGKVRLILSTARPGIVIGRKGVEIEKLRADLRKEFGREFSIEVSEIRRPEVEAQLVAENIAQQLERRIAFRRAMKRTVAMARKFGGEGIKVSCAGRLAGAEIARGEWYRDGRVPLAAGDVLLLYTDGTTEARRPDGAFFGEEGLRDAVMAEQGRPFEGFLDRMLGMLDEFTGHHLDDDVAMVALRFDEVG